MASALRWSFEISTEEDGIFFLAFFKFHFIVYILKSQ